jgi:hypothetical protein
MTTRHEFTVPGWHPARLNQLLGHWARAHRLKKTDGEIIALHAHLAGIPRASGRRRVSLTITLAPRQRAGDPDCYWKSALDGLVRAGLLVDDNRQNVELGPVEFDRGPARATTVLLEEVEVPGVDGGQLVLPPLKAGPDTQPSGN